MRPRFVLHALLGLGLFGIFSASAARGNLLRTFPPGDRAEVAERLRGLGADRAVEREAAEAWLRGHLDVVDRAAVEDVLAPERRAPDEVRARLVEILASEDRHVALAAELSNSASSAARAVGRDALEQAIVRWNPATAERGASGKELVTLVREGRDEVLVIDDGLELEPLDDVLELIVRFGPGGFRLVRDPACPIARDVPRAAVVGTVDSVLSELAARHGARLMGVGFGDAAPRASTRLVVFVPADEGADEAPTMAARVVGWCARIARVAPNATAAEEAEAAACARALGAMGWPAGVVWLARRWRGEDAASIASAAGGAAAGGSATGGSAVDGTVAEGTVADGFASPSARAAFEGVSTAVRRGSVPAQLESPAAQGELRAEIARALQDGERGARRVPGLAVTLARAGNVGPNGEDLVSPALVGLSTATGRALHAQVLELEVRRSPRADVGSALDALLARDDVAPATAWMALLARVGAGAVPGPVARPRELVEWADARGFLADPTTCPALGPSFPPAAWRTAEGLPSEWTPRRVGLVAAWWIARGELDPAVALLEHALRVSTGDDRAFVANVLERLRANGTGSEVDAVVARVLERAARDEPGTRTARHTLVTAAIAGVPFDAARVAALLESLATPVVAREELSALAGIASGADGERARRMLLVAVGGACALDDAMAALDLAVRRLRAIRDDARERAFAREVRERARATRQDLRARVRVDSWPAPPAPVPVRLADFDRSFARAGL